MKYREQLNKELIKKLKQLIFVGYGMEAILEGLIFIVKETIRDADPGDDISHQIKLRDNLKKTLKDYKDRDKK